MEQVLACLTANGKTPGKISARGQPLLHGVANSHVFVLHDFADADAFLIAVRCRFAGVGKIVVEDNGASIYRKWEDKVSVHHAFIGVEHEIGIDPKIKS